MALFIYAYHLQDQAVTVWTGPVQRLDVRNGSRVTDEKQKFVGDASVGFASVARALAKRCNDIQNPVWIGHVRWHPEIKKVKSSNANSG